MRVGELATMARVSQPAMTKVVHQLVTDELVRRIADTDDSRAWQIQITPAGTVALTDWREQLATTLEPKFADLSAADLATLTRAVDILSSRVAVDRKAA